MCPDCDQLCGDGEHCDNGVCKSDGGTSPDGGEQKCPDQECDEFEKSNGFCCQDCGCDDGKTCDESDGFCKDSSMPNING